MFQNPTTSRRAFLALAASMAAGVAATVSPLAAITGRRRPDGATADASARTRRSEHPDPRPGIDARNVTPAGDLMMADSVATFDRVREIPHVVDGIACQCGCAELEDMRSLLSCFEGHGMAQHCIYCQGQADLAYEMNAAGRGLAEIRAAVEAQFG